MENKNNCLIDLIIIVFLLAIIYPIINNNTYDGGNNNGNNTGGNNTGSNQENDEENDNNGNGDDDENGGNDDGNGNGDDDENGNGGGDDDSNGGDDDENGNGDDDENGGNDDGNGGNLDDGSDEEINCNIVWRDYHVFSGNTLPATFNTSGNVNRIIHAGVYLPEERFIQGGIEKAATIKFLLGSDQYEFIMYTRTTGVYGLKVFKNENLIAEITNPYNDPDTNFEATVRFNRKTNNSIKLIPRIVKPWYADWSEIYNGESLNIYGQGDTATVLQLKYAGGILKCE